MSRMDLKRANIDKEWLEKVIGKVVSDESARISSITAKCLSEKGLNFLSDLYEICIKYTVIGKNEKGKPERSLSIVMKVEPAAEMPRDMVQQQNLFITELTFLRDVLPRINKVIGCQVGPVLFHGSDNPRVLLMENLTERGFIIKNRQIGLSFEHCCLVMRQLAKLHAGSVRVFEKNPELIESFIDTGVVSSRCDKPYIRLMEVSIFRIANVMQNWSDVKCSSTADKLIKLSKEIGRRCYEVYDFEPDEFCVLNHGDCWINNMMFRENENGQPIDLLFVDYQMSVYSSPAIDLLYFLNICPEFDIQYDKDDHFLEIYLKTLEETMNSIGCKRKPPTMRELKETIHKRRIYAVFAGMVLHLRMMANKEDTEDFTEVLKNMAGETKMDVFRNPEAVKLGHKMIPIMNERGYFD